MQPFSPPRAATDSGSATTREERAKTGTRRADTRKNMLNEWLGETTGLVVAKAGNEDGSLERWWFGEQVFYTFAVVPFRHLMRGN